MQEEVEKEEPVNDQAVEPAFTDFKPEDSDEVAAEVEADNVPADEVELEASEKEEPSDEEDEDSSTEREETPVTPLSSRSARARRRAQQQAEEEPAIEAEEDEEAAEAEAATRLAHRFFVIEKPGMDVAIFAGRLDDPRGDADGFEED